jgi:nucleotide-binding universal stress UspA family protein
MYKKVLLAYDGSVEGRRALREGAKLAQLCRSEVFLLAVVEVSSIMTPEAGLTIPIELQTEDYKAILNEGTERLKALGFSPTARLEVGDAGQKIAEVAEEIGAHLVVVGHRPQGTLARWFGSIGSYLVKRLRCSVLVAQTEISDTEFERLKPAETAPRGNRTRSDVQVAGCDDLPTATARCRRVLSAPGKGVPMMVTASNGRDEMPDASHHPASTSQMMLPVTPSGPVPISSMPGGIARDRQEAERNRVWPRVGARAQEYRRSIAMTTAATSQPNAIHAPPMIQMILRSNGRGHG